MFSCEFCVISKNTFSYVTPPVAASEKEETFHIICAPAVAVNTLFTKIIEGTESQKRRRSQQRKIQEILA